MKHERTLDEAIRDEVEYIKFRRIPEDKAKTLYEEYDDRYRRSVETRRGDERYFYVLREAYGAYLKEVFNATEWLEVVGYRV